MIELENSISSPVSSKVVRVGLRIVMALLMSAALLQVVSPLRISSDSQVYLPTAASIKDAGFFAAEKTQYPKGYPAVIALLETVGFANAPGIILLNVICVGLGLYCAFRICRDHLGMSATTTYIVINLATLNFVVWKFIAFALSDIVFFGVASLALLLILKTESTPFASSKFWRLLLVSALPCAAAMLIRSVGIALIPALGVAVLKSTGLFETFRTDRKMFRAVFFVVGSITALAAFLLLRNGYGAAFLRYYDWMGWKAVYLLPLGRVRDLTQLLLNVPDSRLPAFHWYGNILGLLPLVLMIAWFFRRRLKLGALEVFLWSYLLILLIAPWPEPRYWIPILPLIIAILVQSIPSRTPRIFVYSYGLIYCILGLVSIVYCTRLSLAGERFPELFGNDGEYKASYQQSMGLRITGGAVNPAVTKILGRYGKQPIHIQSAGQTTILLEEQRQTSR